MGGHLMEVVDYSGDFDPEFSHAKLSKETLLKLREVYANYMRVIDGYWYLVVKEKWGNEVALEYDIAVWEKAVLFKLKATTEALNIHGEDVMTVLKYFQCNPWWALSDSKIEVLGENHAIITEITCPTLATLEREGKGREELHCSQVCPKIKRVRVNYFNPEIRLNMIQIPPRDDKNDICCQWELKL